MTAEARDVWTDAELAAEWKIDLPVLQAMLRSGELQGFKAGKRAWRITDRAKRAHEDAAAAARKAS